MVLQIGTFCKCSRTTRMETLHFPTIQCGAVRPRNSSPDLVLFAFVYHQNGGDGHVISDRVSHNGRLSTITLTEDGLTFIGGSKELFDQSPLISRYLARSKSLPLGSGVKFAEINNKFKTKVASAITIPNSTVVHIYDTIMKIGIYFF